jgi:uncharacterized delta-60 repeat protein
MQVKENAMDNVTVSKRVALLVCAALLSSSTLMMAQAGSLDPTFGIGGIVTTPGTCTAVATAIQTDGKILVAGSISPCSQFGGGLGLARYNTNGSLDTTFGTGGIVSNTATQAFAMALQSDGKIVVGAGTDFSIEVLRFNTNGSLDTTFGTAGVVTFGSFFFVPLAGGIVIQPNGDIVVAVGASNSAFLRLLSNGQFDSSFGTNGSAGVVTGAQALRLLSSGQFLAASSTFQGVVGESISGAVTRYNSNGSLDTTFGVDGQTPSLGLPEAIAPVSDGKIVGAGTLASGASSSNLFASTPQGFALVRYTSDGTIDTTFGTRGSAVTPFPGNSYSVAYSEAVQSNGDIVAAGVTAVNNPAFGQEPASFALARYTSTGQLDTTFGTDGLVTTAFDNNEAFVSALAIQSNGDIVAVGSSGTSNGFTLARYLGQ